MSEGFALIGCSLSELPGYFGCLRVVGGMADAVSVYSATGEPVVCIVGEHNARSIVSDLVEQWPHLKNNIVVALDHDLPGISACHRSDCRWVVPESFGEDWSDVRQRVGLQALKRQLRIVRRVISPVDLKELPAPAVDMAITLFENNYRKSLKRLSEADNEQVAAMLAKAIVVRFHNRVPARCSEQDFLGRIQIANPYLLHPETLSQLKSLLGWYCSQQRQTLQAASGLSLVKQKALGNSYHLVAEIKPQTVPLEKDCITLIKAPYASGKTKLLTALSLAAAQDGQRVLAITHLVSLAHELSKRLGLESYLEIPGPFMSTVQRLVTCVNSLCAPNVDSFLKAGKLDVLLLDEFTQHIGVLGTSPFIKDPSVLSRYLDLIEKTSTVVICDADLSSYHVDLLQQWFPERKIQFYEMPFPRESGLGCHFGAGKNQQKSVVENQLLPAIARGEKVAIALDNRREALRLEKTIRRQLPQVALLELDGKNRNEPCQNAFMQSCNEEAEKYQVVIYTPAIQSGLSITAPFDQVFGFHYNQVLPTDFIQMLRRFRTVKQFTVVADLGVRATGNQDWLSRLQALEHTRRYTRNLDQVAITEYDGFCEGEKVRQLQMGSLGANGLYYLMESRGFTMSYLESEKCSEGFDQTWKMTGKAIKEWEADLLLKAARLTVEQYDQISHKLEPGFQELYSCERFRLCNELGIAAEQLQEHDVEFWQTIGLNRLRRFMLWPLSSLQGAGHYEPQPDPEQMPLCHRRFEQIGVQVYRELLQPLFPDWDYSGEWGRAEAEQVLDRVEQYHQEAPFMLNQLKLIPGQRDPEHTSRSKVQTSSLSLPVCRAASQNGRASNCQSAVQGGWGG